MQGFFLQVVYLIVLLLISAFFSFAEIALAASSRTRLQIASEKGDKRADLVMRLQDKPGPFFAVIQIGLNAVAILGGVVGDTVFSPFFEMLLVRIMPAHAASTTAFVLSFLIVTMAFVVLADLLPKRLTFNNPERSAMAAAPVMALLIKLLAPMVVILDWISAQLVKMMGGSPERDNKITPDDILASVSAGAAAGVVAPEELSVIENVFDLEHRTITTAMTPRESVDHFFTDDTEETIRRRLSKNPHSRYLVCDGDIDHVAGCITSKEILRRLLDNKPISLKEEGIIQPVQFVPDTLSLAEILEVFQRSRTDFAVILNEYAIVVGVVTLNDVMSTVMGDMVLTPEESQIVKRDDESWLVDGSTPTIDLAWALDIDIPTADKPYETAAGFIMYQLRKIPKRTDFINFRGYRFEVLDVDSNRIDQILVTRIKKAPVKSAV